LAGYQHDKETYTYEFDHNGNITRITTGSGAALAYDDAGNLLTDGEFTYTWQMGRRLQGISGVRNIKTNKFLARLRILRNSWRGFRYGKCGRTRRK